MRVEARLGGAGEGAAIDGRLLLGDNLDALAALARPGPGSLLEQIDLVYIDPPFATGGRFSVVTRVGEEGEFTAPAYDDSWEGGSPASCACSTRGCG